LVSWCSSRRNEIFIQLPFFSYFLPYITTSATQAFLSCNNGGKIVIQEIKLNIFPATPERDTLLPAVYNLAKHRQRVLYSTSLNYMYVRLFRDLTATLRICFKRKALESGVSLKQGVLRLVEMNKQEISKNVRNYGYIGQLHPV
jgi:hypothetical protein